MTQCADQRCQPLQNSAEKMARDLASVMREPRLTSIPVRRLLAAASACRPSCTACSTKTVHLAPLIREVTQHHQGVVVN